MDKKWYESKTMWIFGLSGLALIVAPMLGMDVTPEVIKGYEAQMLVVVGLALRLITGKEVVW